MKVGERVASLGRIFNLRNGFTPQDDVMPQRFFTPQASGPLQGVVLDQETFRKAIEAYYEMMDWPDGQPSPVRLGELGISWAASLLKG
jgi:aldehyde:ferredoxin oxidoreductase